LLHKFYYRQRPRITAALSCSDKFVEKQVDYEAFLRNPLSIVNDPNLVVRLGTSRFLNWQAAVPLMVSLAAFKQPLTQVRCDLRPRRV